MAVAASFGVAAIGILLLVVGEDAVAMTRPRSIDKRKAFRWISPMAIGLVTWWVSRWVVAGLVVGAVGMWFSWRTNGRRQVRDERVFVDALATWVEQLRDTLAGAHGLEEAIRVTAPRAPRALHDDVQRLVAHMSYGSTANGLRRFADDVNHPTADFVVSALLTATQHQARDLTVLLSHVAECARDEGRMRSRVWVSRSRTRSSVRIISGVVVVFIGGLFIFSADYLSPYGTVAGQTVLFLICLTFVGALVLMQRFAALAMPERFVRRRDPS